MIVQIDKSFVKDVTSEWYDLRLDEATKKIMELTRGGVSQFAYGVFSTLSISSINSVISPNICKSSCLSKSYMVA